MEQQDLNNFFFKENNSVKRFIGLNFLCAKTNDLIPNAVFSEEFINWLGKRSEMAEKVGILDDYYKLKKNLKKAKTNDEKQDLNRTYQTQLKKLIEPIKQNLIKEWINLVKSNHEVYFEYLNRLFNESNEINYVIISEAPMLTIKEKDETFLFDCKYIFSKTHKNVGDYRRVPYIAISTIKNESEIAEKPSADEIITLFIKYRVLFLDLIPIPLPKIDSELRKNWSTNAEYYINNEPRVITFLKCSLEFIFEFVKNKTKKEICFSDPKIALMMPSNTALGIINFYLNTNNKHEPFQNKIIDISQKITRQNNNIDAQTLFNFSLRLHRQVAIGSKGGPELELLKHALSS
jgi:hypothetical protein